MAKPKNEKAHGPAGKYFGTLGLVCCIGGLIASYLAHRHLGAAARSKYKLAVLVPFRDRFDELLRFVPHLSGFLEGQAIDYQIVVANQVDEYRFNRASLINAAFLEAMNDCDYVAMHDVDLLPLNAKLNYSLPANGVAYHVSAPGLHPKYDYKSFLGGIVIIGNGDFIRANGMSNRYWGWGREDDDFYLRLRKLNIRVERPSLDEITTGKQFTFEETTRQGDNRKRDTKRFPKQKQQELQDIPSGLNNIQYAVRHRRQLLVDGYPCSVLDVQLFCDRMDTHWCNSDYQFIG